MGDDLWTAVRLVVFGLGGLIGVWAIVRVASWAYFKSRRDYDEGKL